MAQGNSPTSIEVPAVPAGALGPKVPAVRLSGRGSQGRRLLGHRRGLSVRLRGVRRRSRGDRRAAITRRARHAGDPRCNRQADHPCRVLALPR